MRILILGATGLVGRNILKLALEDSRVSAVVAPVRRELDQHEKLTAPIINFDNITKEEVCSWNCEAIICALGTTIKTAGSKEAFSRVDLEYPLLFAKLGKECGAKSFVLNSAMGANANSLIFYNKVKGQVEDGLALLDYGSLTYVRPGVIGGERDEFRFGELAAKLVLGVVSPIIPRKLRINPARKIAEVMLESALSSRKGVRVISSEELI